MPIRVPLTLLLALALGCFPARRDNTKPDTKAGAADAGATDLAAPSDADAASPPAGAGEDAQAEETTPEDADISHDLEEIEKDILEEDEVDIEPSPDTEEVAPLADDSTASGGEETSGDAEAPEAAAGEDALDASVDDTAGAIEDTAEPIEEAVSAEDAAGVADSGSTPADAGSEPSDTAPIDAGCATAQDCPAPEPGDACKFAQCNKGACGFAKAPDGTACDDGVACTSGDACAAGTCAGGPAACDDGNACTADACNLATGICEHANAPAPCAVGVICKTLGDACIDGACVAGAPDPDCCEGTGGECDDADPCTDDVCLPSGACQHTPKAGNPSKTAPCTWQTCDRATGNGVDYPRSHPVVFFAEDFDAEPPGFAFTSTGAAVTCAFDVAAGLDGGGGLRCGDKAGGYGAGGVGALAILPTLVLPPDAYAILVFDYRLDVDDSAPGCPTDFLELRLGKTALAHLCATGSAWKRVVVDLAAVPAGTPLRPYFRFAAGAGPNTGTGARLDRVRLVSARPDGCTAGAGTVRSELGEVRSPAAPIGAGAAAVAWFANAGGVGVARLDAAGSPLPASVVSGLLFAGKTPKTAPSLARRGDGGLLVASVVDGTAAAQRLDKSGQSMGDLPLGAGLGDRVVLLQSGDETLALLSGATGGATLRVIGPDGVPGLPIVLAFGLGEGAGHSLAAARLGTELLVSDVATAGRRLSKVDAATGATLAEGAASLLPSPGQNPFAPVAALGPASLWIGWAQSATSPAGFQILDGALGVQAFGPAWPDAADGATLDLGVAGEIPVFADGSFFVSAVLSKSAVPSGLTKRALLGGYFDKEGAPLGPLFPLDTGETGSTPLSAAVGHALDAHSGLVSWSRDVPNVGQRLLTAALDTTCPSGPERCDGDRHLICTGEGLGYHALPPCPPGQLCGPNFDCVPAGSAMFPVNADPRFDARIAPGGGGVGTAPGLLLTAWARTPPPGDDVRVVLSSLEPSGRRREPDLLVAKGPALGPPNLGVSPESTIDDGHACVCWLDGSARAHARVVGWKGGGVAEPAGAPVALFPGPGPDTTPSISPRFGGGFALCGSTGAPGEAKVVLRQVDDAGALAGTELVLDPAAEGPCSLVYHPTAGLVAAWIATQEGTTVVRATRIDVNGAALDTPPVGLLAPSPSPADPGERPALAIAASGTHLLAARAATGFPGGEANDVLHEIRALPALTLVSPPALAHVAATGDQRAPSAAASGEGFVLGWQSEQFGAHDLYARRFGVDGKPATGPQKLNTLTAFANEHLALVNLGETGLVAVFLSRFSDWDGWGIVGQHLPKL